MSDVVYRQMKQLSANLTDEEKARFVEWLSESIHIENQSHEANAPSGFTWTEKELDELLQPFTP